MSLGQQGDKTSQSQRRSTLTIHWKTDERLMMKLKFRCFGHLMQTDDSLEKSLMLGKVEGRRRGCQRMRGLDGITDGMNMNLGELLEDGEGQGGLACCRPWGRKELDTIGGLKSNNRTTIKQIEPPPLKRKKKDLRHRTDQK